MIAAQVDPEGQTPRIHILVAHMHGTLSEQVVQYILQQPDMLIVGQVQEQVELLLAVNTEIDVLVMSHAQVAPLPGICSHLLSEFPELRIIVIAAESGSAIMYWLGLRHRELGTISPESLPGDIRYAYALNPVA